MRARLLAFCLLLLSSCAAVGAEAYRFDNGVFTVPLTVKDNSGVERRAWPVTTGVPLPPGAVDDPRKLRLVDAAGREIPAQFTVLSRYRSRDDTLRWVLVDFQLDLPPRGVAVVKLTNDRPAAAVPDPLEISTQGDLIRVRSGAFEAGIPTRDGSLLRTVSLGGKPILRAVTGDGPALRTGEVTLAEHFRGRQWNPAGWEKETRLEPVRIAEADYRAGQQAPDSVEIESSGPLRAVVLIRGRYLPVTRGAGVIEGGPYRYTTRLHFYRGHSYIKVEHSVDNSGREQPQWSHLFREASLSHGLQLGTGLVLSGGGFEAVDGSPAAAAARLPDGAEGWLYQSGASNAGAAAREVGVPGRYRVGTGTDGVVAAPIATGKRGRYLDLSDGSHGLGIAIRHLWQQAPRAIALSRERVRVLLHADAPGRKAGADGKRPEYDLDFGERSLNDVLYYFHAGSAEAARVADVAEAFEYPLFAYAPPAWYSDSGAWYFEIGREPGTRLERGADSDGHWEADGAGVEGYGRIKGSYNSGGHHETLNSGWLSFMRTGLLADLERNLAYSRWAISRNPGWAYVDNVLRLGEGSDRLKALDRQLLDWDRITGFGPKDFYLWRSAETYTERTPRGEVVRHHGPRSYLNAYKKLPDHEHYAFFRLFEYYYLTGDRRALDAIHGFVNWAVNFEHRHLFRRETQPLSVTDLFTRDPEALHRGHYARVYTWMLYTTLAGYQATDSPVFDLYARWQVRRILALLRNRHGQLTSARDKDQVLGKQDDPTASVLASAAQSWMESQGVLALHEAYKAYDDERILDALWGQADYFAHHVIYFPRLAMLNNWTGMPNLLLGHRGGRRGSLSPVRHDLHVQMWPLLYHYTGWAAVRERYQAFEAARASTPMQDWFLQTGLWERQNVPKRGTRAPDAVTDLRVVEAGRGGITLEWTSPRAYGPEGRAARYFVKYSDKPIVEFAPTDHPARAAAKMRLVQQVEEQSAAAAAAGKRPRKVTRVDFDAVDAEPEDTQRWHPDWHRVNAFWMAEHVAGEPQPAAPGVRERFTIRSLRPHNWFGLAEDPGLEILRPGTYYLALCSWDADRNLSALSNVVKVELR